MIGYWWRVLFWLSVGQGELGYWTHWPYCALGFLSSRFVRKWIGLRSLRWGRHFLLLWRLGTRGVPGWWIRLRDLLFYWVWELCRLQIRSRFIRQRRWVRLVCCCIWWLLGTPPTSIRAHCYTFPNIISSYITDFIQTFIPHSLTAYYTLQYLLFFWVDLLLILSQAFVLSNFMMFLSKKITASFSSFNVLKGLHSYKNSPAQKHFHSFVRDERQFA